MWDSRKRVEPMAMELEELVVKIGTLGEKAPSSIRESVQPRVQSQNPHAIAD
jgi:hypothetical protein